MLNAAGVPLSIGEIFAEIVEQGLYGFATQKPVAELAAELDKYTLAPTAGVTVDGPVFVKAEGGKIRLWHGTTEGRAEPKDWLSQLLAESPELAKEAAAYGVLSEEAFMDALPSLPIALRNQLDDYRFRTVLGRADSEDPNALLDILPFRVLESPIDAGNPLFRGMRVRVWNVLNDQGIRCLNELRDVPVAEMRQWRNFGAKSVRDLCEGMIAAAGVAAASLIAGQLMDVSTGNDESVGGGVSEASGAPEAVSLVTSISLKENFERALTGLSPKARQVIEGRTGSVGTIMTLEAVGDSLGVSRERVRQLQKKYINEIIEAESWDDCIGRKLGELLIDREEPLYLKMLEIEDPWFAGFMGNYQHLGSIIELFSENEFHIIKVGGASLVTRSVVRDWEGAIRDLRSILKENAVDNGWTRRKIDTTFRDYLFKKGAPELAPLLWREFDASLQFAGAAEDAKLLSFGLSVDSAVRAVLADAESPLHFKEVAVRATAFLGKPVNKRTAHECLMSQGAMGFGRGLYGLDRFNPISSTEGRSIIQEVCRMMYEGPLMRQWHADELLSNLQEDDPNLPPELDQYILSMVLQESDRLVYLNRMIWSRADSNQTPNDRIDVAESLEKILEDHGGPLKTKELKSKQGALRSVASNQQPQPTERLILVGPDRWGLIDRDVRGAREDNQRKLEDLYQVLQRRQKGVHVREVAQYVEVSDHGAELPSAYMLCSLAKLDDRFRLSRGMSLGLVEWGDARRLNASQAVKEVLRVMKAPISTAEINRQVESLMELKLYQSVANQLVEEGAIYDHDLKVWRKN